MNPAKSSLSIFFIIAGICILSILASPSLRRQQKTTSTTESPVNDEDASESDQLTLRKRNVPARRQGGTSTAQPPSRPASDQLTRRKRCLPPFDEEDSSTTQSPSEPESDQLTLRKRQVPPRLHGQGASSTTQASSGPASDQLTIFKRNVPARRQGGSSTTQAPSGSASDQLTLRKRQVPPRPPRRSFKHHPSSFRPGLRPIDHLQTKCAGTSPTRKLHHSADIYIRLHPGGEVWWQMIKKEVSITQQTTLRPIKCYLGVL